MADLLGGRNPDTPKFGFGEQKSAELKLNGRIHPGKQTFKSENLWEKEYKSL